ncbi:MAG: hypothetical protein ABI624_18490 [Casimicrobiaceae bacterium]
MRNPRLWRAAGLVCLASGIIAALAPFLLPAAMAGDSVRTGLFAYGLTALIFGALGALTAHLAARAQEALARGDDVIARWHIDAATWRAFAALDGRRNSEPHALHNALSIRDTVPAEGIEVIVGKSAVQIDESVHPLPRHGAPEITRAQLVSDSPDYVELQLLYPGGGHGASGVPQGPTRMALRFPVAPKSWRDARRVVAHFSGVLPGEPDFFHGRGDGSDPEDLNTCIDCGYQTHQYRSVCPQCGGSMVTRRWGRRFGGILVVCGLAITGIMGVVSYYTVPLMLHPGKSIDGTRFSGTQAEALFALGIFAVVTAFGLTALFYGIWQVKTGKRDKRVALGMVALWTVLLLVAYVI